MVVARVLQGSSAAVVLVFPSLFPPGSVFALSYFVSGTQASGRSSLGDVIDHMTDLIHSWVVGLALLADTVPPQHLAQAMGYVSLGMSLGLLVAPMLGGIVFDRAGYNAVFGMAYALVGVDIVLRLLLVEKKVAARWDPEAARRLREIRGGVEMEGDVAGGGGNEEQEHGDISGEQHQHTISTPAPATDPEKGITTTSTPPQDPAPPPSSPPPRIRVRDRLPPVLSLLYSRRLLAALFIAIIQASLLTSFDSVLTIHVARIFHWTATGAALLFLPIVIPSFLAPLFGYLSDRIGGRYPASIGFLLACPPLVCLRFVDEDSIKDKVLICALLALVGLTLSATFPALMAEISIIVEAKEKKMLANGGEGYGKGGAYAQAYGLFNVAFAAGCMIGPLLAGFIVEDRGWETMAWVLGMLSAVTAVPTFVFIGGYWFKKDDA